MTQASSTTLGQIVLSGDLAGSTDATLPGLSITGVTAGSYVTKKISVDKKGRVLNIGSLSTSDLSLADFSASATQLGLVKLSSDYKNSSGAISVNPATSTSNGFVITPTPFTNSSGTVSYSTLATKSSKGLVICGSTFTVDSAGLLNPKLATSSNLGVVSAGQGFSITSVVLSANIASKQRLGLVKAASASIGASPRLYSLTATSDGAGAYILNLTQPSPSTEPSPGYAAYYTAKIGTNLAIDSSGVLSYTGIQISTTSTAGVVKVGTGLSVDGTGTLTPSLATTSTAGVVKGSSSINIDGSGVASINPPTADSSTLGLIKLGYGLTSNSVGNTFLSLPIATPSSTGTIIGTSTGVISLPIATSSTAGVVIPSSNFDLDVTGNLSVGISANYRLGIVKVGSNLAVDANGIVSTANLKTASDTSQFTKTIADVPLVASGQSTQVAWADGDSTSTFQNASVTQVTIAEGQSKTITTLAVTPQDPSQNAFIGGITGAWTIVVQNGNNATLVIASSQGKDAYGNPYFMPFLSDSSVGSTSKTSYIDTAGVAKTEIYIPLPTSGISIFEIIPIKGNFLVTKR